MHVFSLIFLLCNSYWSVLFWNFMKVFLTLIFVTERRFDLIKEVLFTYWTSFFFKAVKKKFSYTVYRVQCNYCNDLIFAFFSNTFTSQTFNKQELIPVMFADFKLFNCKKNDWRKQIKNVKHFPQFRKFFYTQKHLICVKHSLVTCSCLYCSKHLRLVCNILFNDVIYFLKRWTILCVVI